MSVVIKFKSKSGCVIFLRVPLPSKILQETGFAILQENGDFLLKEQE